MLCEGVDYHDYFCYVDGLLWSVVLALDVLAEDDAKLVHVVATNQRILKELKGHMKRGKTPKKFLSTIP